jgi:hypothetical protein
MAGTFTSTGAYSNITRLELEQLRRGDFTAGGKALTIGDSALLPEGVVGKGNVNSESFYSNASIMLKEVLSVLPPSKPGDFLQKNLNIYPNGSESAEWYGPTEISFGAEFDSPTAMTAFPTASQFQDLAADFITDGVQAGDLILIEMPAQGNKVAVVSVVDDLSTLTVTDITGGSWAANTVNWYQIVRPNAVQLFAVPGSGPVGQEQTFLFVIPGSTLHSTVGPTTDAVNLDRVRNIVSPRYALDTTVDRADAVYVSPAPHTTLSSLGYRVVLYPDDGSGTAPDLSSPITSLNPVIDPAIPADDQRMTIDYAAGTVRFSCAPTLSGQIKVAGGVNGTTGRLNLYAVFWAIDKRSAGYADTYTNSTARGLYVPNENGTTPTAFAALRNNGISWVFVNQWITGVGQPQIQLSGNAVGDRNIHTLGVDDSIQSITKKLNAQGVTCGDGVKSFGDFNGATALEQVIAYWIGTAPLNDSLTIFLKGGDYTLGNSNFNVPAGKEVIIRGEGREATHILFDGGSSITTCIGVNAGSRLHLADLAIRYGTGGYLSAQGSVSADRCLFEEISISYSNATPYKASTTGPNPFLSIFTDCEFNNDLSHPFAGAPRSAISIYASGTSMKGFVFRNCYMRSATAGGVVVYVTTFGAGSLAATVSDVAFENCVIDLPAVDTTSATVIATSAGVLAVDPELTVDVLTVDKVRFIDCTVSVVDNTRNNTVLLHLMPLPFNAADATTERAIIGTVEISGGVWSVPLDRGTDFVPFFLQCFKPIVKNVAFVGGGQETLAFNTSPGFRGNGFYSVAQRVSLSSTDYISVTDNLIHHGWATIAASGTSIENTTGAANIDSGLVIRDISFTRFHRKAGRAGYLVLVGPNSQGGPADVDGIYIHSPRAAGSAGNTNVPLHWIFIITGGLGSSTVNRGTNGSFRGITITVNNTSSSPTGANPDQWVAGSFLVLQPEGRLVVEDPVIHPALVGGTDPNTSNGIGIKFPWGPGGGSSGTGLAMDLGPLQILRPDIQNCWIGIDFNNPLVSGGPVGPIIIDGLRNYCVGGTWPNNYDPLYGIRLSCTSIDFGRLVVNNCQSITSQKNSSNFIGILIQGTTWRPRKTSVITNNIIYTDYGAGFIGGSGAGIAVLSGNAASEPAFHVSGNACTGMFGSADNIGSYLQLQRQNVTALLNNSLTGGAYYTHAETGHSITSTVQYSYVDASNMVHNNAVLKTP